MTEQRTLKRFVAALTLNDAEASQAKEWIGHHRKTARALINLVECLNLQGRNKAKELLVTGDTRDIIHRLFIELKVPKSVWRVAVRVINNDVKPTTFTLSNGVSVVARKYVSEFEMSRPLSPEFAFEFVYDGIRLTHVRGNHLLLNYLTSLIVNGRV